jgi:hypothetical protein
MIISQIYWMENAKREPFVRFMSVSFQCGIDNKVKILNSNEKDSGY